MFNHPLIESIYTHVESLAEHCDMAREKDGVGFSKSDLIGHYIAELPRDHFDEEWLIISCELIVKYNNQLNTDIKPYIDFLNTLKVAKRKNVKSNRKGKVLNRILLTTNDDFEIYFPNKNAMKGFDYDSISNLNWVSEKKIPHGYCFIVDKGAREFVEHHYKKLQNWFVTKESKAAILNTKLDCIDVERYVDYELYIQSDSLKESVAFKFNFNNSSRMKALVEKIKLFSYRRFRQDPIRWVASLRTEEDLSLLKELMSEYSCHFSEDLKSLKQNPRKTLSLLKKHLEIVRNNLSKEESLLEELKDQPPKFLVDCIDRCKTFTIKFSKFDMKLVNYIKTNLQNKSFDRDNSLWNVQASENNILKLHQEIANEDWIFTQKASNLIKRKGATLVDKEITLKNKLEESFRISSSFKADDDFKPNLSKLTGTLFPFQTSVIQYASTNNNIFISDEMGLGKTLSSLACAVAFELDDSVIINCPAIARLTWMLEINKWLPNASVYIAKKANSKKNAKKEHKDILEADFVIVSYNKVGIYQEILRKRKSKLYIGDESHYLKNEKSQRYQASHSVSKTCERVYLLSGTPLTNRPIELVTQLDMLGLLDSHFDGSFAFKMRYCDAKHNGYGWNFNGASNLQELRNKLRQTCLIRRLRKQVMKDLPEKRRMKIPVEISNRAEYNEANANFISTIKQKALQAATRIADAEKMKGENRISFINEHIRTAAEKSAKAKMLTHTNYLKGIVGRGLVNCSVEWIENFCLGEEPLVVFADRVEVQKEIYKLLSKNSKLRVGRISATDNDVQKKNTEIMFQNSELDVVVCSQKGASTNITLTRATTVLTIEYTWTPGDHLQAEDRCLRIGTREDIDNVDCYYLHAAQTVDDIFASVVEAKMEVIEQTLDTDDVESFENANSSTAKGILNEMLKRFDFIHDTTKLAA